MTTFTELVAAVIVQSSTVAYSHFGVTLEPVRAEPPAVVERVVVRKEPAVTPRKADKVLDCPVPRARMVKA